MTILTENELPPPNDINIFSQECFCGDNRWKLWVVWDNDKDIASFSKEMYCVSCNYKAVTPPYDYQEE